MLIVKKPVLRLMHGRESPEEIYSRGNLVKPRGVGRLCYGDDESPVSRAVSYVLDENGDLVPYGCLCNFCVDDDDDGRGEGWYMAMNLPKSLAPGGSVELCKIKGSGSMDEAVSWQELAASVLIDSRGGRALGAEPLPTDPQKFLEHLDEGIFVRGGDGWKAIVVHLCSL